LENIHEAKLLQLVTRHSDVGQSRQCTAYVWCRKHIW